ncbi:hypothetical protein NPIL_64201 [Nephila pilipes]|uniref:Uncharacterized protein n=1 Tax=Nephila pilipes TaxID=299642 RepID=A0A8X6P5Y1_NEPPI|nr:hypothetical protein NPIL_64201 [Nephila pilipes]
MDVVSGLHSSLPLTLLTPSPERQENVSDQLRTRDMQRVVDKGRCKIKSLILVRVLCSSPVSTPAVQKVPKQNLYHNFPFNCVCDQDRFIYQNSRKYKIGTEAKSNFLNTELYVILHRKTQENWLGVMVD